MVKGFEYIKAGGVLKMLLQMKEYLDDLVVTISTVIGLEITILDKDMIRVTGTGNYRSEEYKFRDIHMAKELSGTRKSLETGRNVIVYNSVEEFPHLKNFEKAFILCPMKKDHQIIGVIGFIAFSKEQQDYLMTNSTKLLRFLEKITKLTLTKIQEEELNKEKAIINHELNLLFENVKEGFILIDTEKRIKQINKAALQLLRKEYREVLHEKIEQLNINKLPQMIENAMSFQETIEAELTIRIDSNTSLFFVVKPIIVDGFTSSVLVIIEDVYELKRVMDIVESGYQHTNVHFNEIYGKSDQIFNIKNRVTQIAQYDSTVLVTGESGTGKELIARAVHNLSKRKDGPLVSINCAALPEDLMESELFGYEEGAFTGAKKGGKRGKIVLANKGTLFLDEIGDMPLSLQAKLLRVIQEKKVDTIGGLHPVNIDVRFIAATNKNLQDMVNEGKFREDLYYRINVIPIEIPPLRKRKEDIEEILGYFIKVANKKFDKNIKGVTLEVMRVFHAYEWPGNVRELQNCIEYMMNFEASPYLTVDSLPKKLIGIPTLKGKSLKEMCKQYELKIIKSMIDKYPQPFKEKYAKDICQQLGISRTSFYRKYKEVKEWYDC